MQNWYNIECEKRGMSHEEDSSFDINAWECSYEDQNTNSRQSDSHSCSGFCCMYIAYKMKLGKIPASEDFTQADIPDIRKYILYTILFANQSIEVHVENDYDKRRIAELDNANIMNFVSTAVYLSK